MKGNKGGNPAWVKGVSGNPGGRMGVPPEAKEALKAHSLEAVLKLVEFMRGADAKLALRAAEKIVDKTVPDLVENTNVADSHHMKELASAILQAEGTQLLVAANTLRAKAERDSEGAGAAVQ